MNNEEITEEEIIDWLGHDWQFSQIIEILQDLANGDYLIENMIKDIKNNNE
tara:strand:+ start:614 stop:766 length:153 start_codon:yes stop_codon:yes gene_type:complete